jgi:SOS response regulatory protein OraA/RecX
MITNVDEIYAYALKLLKARDYSVAGLSEKLKSKFEVVPDDLIELLVRKNFLNDRRFAENYVRRRKSHGRPALVEELLARGIAEDLAEETLKETQWPSLRDAVAAKMKGLKLRTPLQSRDAARLFRALIRLGYDEDAIREEIESIHEQQ